MVASGPLGDPVAVGAVAAQHGGGFDTVAERIYKFPQVKSVILMSGSYDLLVTVEGKSLKEVAMFVSERLAVLDGVLSTTTHFVLRRYKEKNHVFSEEHSDERSLVSP